MAPHYERRPGGPRWLIGDQQLDLEWRQVCQCPVLEVIERDGIRRCAMCDAPVLHRRRAEEPGR